MHSEDWRSFELSRGLAELCAKNKNLIACVKTISNYALQMERLHKVERRDRGHAVRFQFNRQPYLYVVISGEEDTRLFVVEILQLRPESVDRLIRQSRDCIRLQSRKCSVVEHCNLVSGEAVELG